MPVPKPLQYMVDWIIRLVILGGMFIVATPIALVMALCGASPGAIMALMGICGLVGVILGRKATVPARVLPDPPPPTAQARPAISPAAKIKS